VLEVVVALAVTATTLVVLQRASADALRARARLETDVQQRGAVRATIVHLMREVAAAVPGTLRIDSTHARSSPLLEFAVDEPAPEIIRYRMVERRLERTTTPRFGFASTSGAPMVMLGNVRSFGVRGRDRDGWHDRWDHPRPPALLALELTLASGERLAATVPLLAGALP
jgi:hypothetical protein